MKTLKFKLISNKEVLIDEESTYYIKDNVIIFKINNELYKFGYKEKTI